MQVKQLFLSPKDVALIFNMSVWQVINHAKKQSIGFPRAKIIYGERNQYRFDIAEVNRCITQWREMEEEAE